MLSDFSNIFAFAATLNIAFVVVSHAKSYTNLLANYIFGFKDNVNECFSRRRNSIALDLSSIRSMPDVVVGNSSTLKKKQKLIRDAEILDEDINKKETLFFNEIDEICSSKKFSLFSLLMFFYCIVGMFLCAWNNDSSIIGLFYIFSLLILLGCTIIALKKDISFMWTIVIFICSLLLSFLSYIPIIHNFFEPKKLYVLILACFPFLFFISFFFWVRFKRKRIIERRDEYLKNFDENIKKLDDGLKVLNEIKGISSDEV